MKLTQQAQQVMDRANEEAHKWRHEYIGTEHVLLALAEIEGTAQQILAGLSATPDRVRQTIEALIQPGPDETAPGKHPHMPRLKEAVERASEEAQNAGCASVGTEHLLLGILGVPDSIGAQALAKLGVTVERVRAQLLNVVSISGQSVDEVKRFLNSLLYRAIEARASDIHLDATEGGAGRVRLRIDGRLSDLEEPLSPELFGAVVERIKVMGMMDTAKHNQLQDGSIALTIDGRTIDLRVSVAPIYHGERAVVRILRREAAMRGLDKLGLSPQDHEALVRMATLPSGMVIVTGPTGCGKTTLLYSMLRRANQSEVSVVTIEDPVECTFAGMAQMQLNPSAGLTFPRAIRSVLRQDPDVMMVGEIRDVETLQLCVQAALVGHLVFTTLHTNSAVGAYQRLLEMGLEPFLVNSTVAGIVAMRLIRVLCPKCKQPGEPALHLLPPDAQNYVASLPQQTFFVPKGCPQCAGTGYRHRTAVFEVLVPSGELRRRVNERAEPDHLLEAAIAGGMRTLFEDALAKAAAGLTTVQEALWLANP